MALPEWAGIGLFKWVHGHQLIYNTCWEDPRLDREALQLSERDRVVVITSAGCNALDYVLAGAGEVHAVDLNPRQNALLELKLAGVRGLEFEDFFALFGLGCLPGVARIYPRALRPHLSSTAQAYWDRAIRLFDHPRGRSFYFRGTSGAVARGMNFYLDWIVGLRPAIEAVLSAASLAEQQQIYRRELRGRFWTRPLRAVVNSRPLMTMLGVPRSQQRQVEAAYEGRIAGFIEQCLDAVFNELPLADNYFWRVYLTGAYTRACCPEYLKPDNFGRLKAGLADRVRVYTGSVEQFLAAHDQPITRFVLLDHMDWLCDKLQACLASEWQAIVDRAAPHARVIWRSGGVSTDFVDRIKVRTVGGPRSVGEIVGYQPEMAARLHCRCRVHTYASFHIADLAV